MRGGLSRKAFLRNAARVAAGAIAGVTGLNAVTRNTFPAAADLRPLPWPYAALDPEVTRKLAHDSFYEGGCGYAGFAAILRSLQEKVGDPFTTLPLQLMSYSGAGIKGWGTVCGALNGASAAIGLVTDARASGQIIDELIGWYTRSLLPSDVSNQYGETHQYKTDRGIRALQQNRSGSPLCHVSVTEWCVASGFSVNSPERAERCARLSGDVTAQAVKLLNDQAQNKFRAEFVTLASTAECLGCHGAGGEAKNVSSKQDCLPCHQDHRK